MLSQKTQTQISLIAYATVSHLFAMFHNPKMRGENFTWEKFPDLASRHVSTQVFLSVVLKDEKKQEEAKEYGKKLGLEIASNMVKWMTE